MCGLAGFLTIHGHRSEELKEIASAMADRIRHRGPDDSGVYVDEAAGLALSHRRLSIQDLSPAGSQPMVSGSGRFVIVYNGEIYNHLELRAELNPEPAWRGHSDTETLLALVDAFGLEAALKKIVGMFALALWDRKLRVLFLARDRLGEKPMYYGWQGREFLFGSELAALRAHPAFCAGIDRDALELFLKYNCVPAPYSIYQGIRKLPPASFLRLEPGRPEAVIRTYWSAADAAELGRLHPFTGDESEAAGELENLLKRSVSGQMISDVPLGAFLSGGVDSSTVVSLMQAVSSRPVRTFTIGYREARFDEAAHARRVAEHLGTDHTELRVSADEAGAVIPRLPRIYDEPFADASQVPTWLVSNLARGHVTVSLSGDGGDEVFGGYNRHFWVGPLWKRLKPWPVGWRRAMARGVNGVSPAAWNRTYQRLARLIPSRLQASNPGDKLHKLAGVMDAAGPEDIYDRLVSQWSASCGIVIGGRREPAVSCLDDCVSSGPFERKMMLWDMITYLPNDILVKVDRAAMNVSLETRVPFLDHRVVEFAWRLPLPFLIDRGQGKRLLRRVLYKYVPQEIIERPKMGFDLPLDEWLRGPLKDWGASLIERRRLDGEGYLCSGPIQQLWAEHQSGRWNRVHGLWGVLMFQAWLETQ